MADRFATFRVPWLGRGRKEKEKEIHHARRGGEEEMPCNELVPFREKQVPCRSLESMAQEGSTTDSRAVKLNTKCNK